MLAHQITDKAVIEETRELPIHSESDVVVAGGGPAGFVSAIAASRAGAKVTLIEGNSFLGGVATAAMMTAFVGSSWAKGISLELLDRLAEKGGAPKWDFNRKDNKTTPFDPEILKEVTLEMILESGINLMLYTNVCAPIVIDGKVRGIITESKSGRKAVLGKVVIDCTGDADLAFKAGAPFMQGRPSDNKMRPFALIFRVGGLDIPKMDQYVKDNPDELQPQHTKGTHLQVGDQELITRISGFYKLVEEAKKNGELFPECHYLRFEALWTNKGIAICNTTRIYNVDGTNVSDLTRGEIEGREQIRKLVSFMRKYVPGCENAFVIDVAPKLGVRETRRIIGEYSLTDDDAYNDVKFEDAYLTMDSMLIKGPIPENLDVHMPDPIEGSEKDLLERNPEAIPREKHSYQIPYRVLLPRGVEQLLVAGRSISVSHMIDGSTRNMIPCMRAGQVAGIAAALSAKQNVSPKEIDFKYIKEELAKQNYTDI